MFDLTTLTSALPLADSDGPGWWIVFAPLGWLLVVGTVFVLLRVFVFRRGRWGAGWGCGPGGPRSGGPTSAAEILERRFAEGELSADDYRERRAVLGDSPISPSAEGGGSR
jgi:putative membrane protein